MKIIFLLLIITLTIQYSISQNIRVAILDFENVSGNIKYDGLGKAMSSMLISDIEANVSPKRLQLVERTQIQKVLKEQNFQVSGSVDKNTMVQAGKILGVSYLLIGDVYVLNDQLIINARLTNSETGDILFSRKQEGKIIDWLILKSNIAKDLAINLAQPFTSPTIPDKEINAATITTFGNAIVAKDNGELNKAENLIETIKEFNPEFKYLDDLKLELDALKKQVAEQAIKIEILNKSGGLVIDAKNYTECWNNMISPLTTDSSDLLYLEYIIDNFPDEAVNNSQLYAFPLIWEQIIFFRYIESENNVIADLNRMINHISKTKYKKEASMIYSKRIKMIEWFEHSYSQTTLYQPKLSNSKWNTQFIFQKRNQLKELIEKYNPSAGSDNLH